MITPLSIKKNHILIVLSAFFSSLANAQPALENYVAEGLANNLVLQQKNVSAEKAMLALKNANRLFLPSLTLMGDYQSGEGGRSISIPVGDMLNPVYSTLNHLTMSDAFPQISNVNTEFLPNNFYDAKVRAAMPLVNTDLIYNRKIKAESVKISAYEAEVYKTELTKEIKTAYYNYLSALKSQAIYESALQLAGEGKRVNESLVKNGKAVPAYVLRSESEMQNVQADLSDAVNKTTNARLYFNFLINTSSDRSIDTSGASSANFALIEQYLQGNGDGSQRSELKLMQSASSLQGHLLSMNKAFRVPKLSAFVDAGSQASDWEYTHETRYYFAGVKLEVPLFAWGANDLKVKQARLDLKNQQLSNTNNQNGIRLSVEIARNNLRTAYENYKSAQKQLEAASTYHNLIEKGYREGVSTFIESVDGRTQLTMASQKVVLNLYRLQTAQAAFEREISK